MQLGAGLLFGAGIGLVSSLLGVTAGELLIPMLVFAFGVDIGDSRYGKSADQPADGGRRLDRPCEAEFLNGSAGMGRNCAPMGVGPVVGGVLVNGVSPTLLKALLGMILIYSAGRVFLKQPREDAVVRKECGQP